MEAASAPRPRGNFRTYSHPDVVGWLALAGVVVCVASGLLMLLSVRFMETTVGNWLLLLFCAGILGATSYVSLAILRMSRDTIVVADDGLRRQSPNGQTLLIPWNEIGDVEPQNVMQRLVVVDLGGTRRISLEYHLENFGELRRIVLERATRRNPRPGEVRR